MGMGPRIRRPLHNRHSGPEPESRGGDLGLNPMPILSNMVSHQQLCKGLHSRGQRVGVGDR